MREWANNYLEELSNPELVEGLAHVGGKEQIINRVFDEHPWVEAIEDIEDYTLLLQTKLWKQYLEPDELM